MVSLSTAFVQRCHSRSDFGLVTTVSHQVPGDKKCRDAVTWELQELSLDARLQILDNGTDGVPS